MHSGKSVEINNTDAEGRLLLADGLSYAARENCAADVLIDAATLTGAQMIATGQVHGAVMTNDDGNGGGCGRRPGKRTGDLVHPSAVRAGAVPVRVFASKVADMRNSVANRGQRAVLLRRAVPLLAHRGRPERRQAALVPLRPRRSGLLQGPWHRLRRRPHLRPRPGACRPWREE